MSTGTARGAPTRRSPPERAGSETAAPDGPTTRQARSVIGALVAGNLLVVVPYLLDGPGFFVDDWRVLGRLHEVGVLRAAEWGKLASRPGAWVVDTILYGTLREHLLPWVLALAVLDAAATVAVYLLLRRFVGWRTAAAVAGLWVVLPDHTSLRTLPNAAPIVVALLLLAVGLLLVDDDRPVLGALVLCAGASCYEATFVPGLLGFLALHVRSGRGTPRTLRRGIALFVLTAAGLALHPTYAIDLADRGPAGPLLPAHVGAGLTASPRLATVLTVVAGVAAVAGAVEWWRGDRARGSGPWLMAAGAVVAASGLVAFAFKLPQEPRGIADRAFVVSSVGSALFWVGVAKLVRRRSRLATVLVGTAFLVVLLVADVTFQRDWSRSGADARALLRDVERCYPAGPPSQLTVGPAARYRGGVRSLHDFFVPEAAVAELGHPVRFHLAETEADWRKVPVRDRVTWTRILSGCP